MSERAHSQPIRYIVEIGHGTHPFPAPDPEFPIIQKRTLAQNEQYIGVDIFTDKSKREETAKSIADLNKNTDGKYRLEYGDGTSLRFGERTIHEIVYCNVFGGSTDETRQKLAQEAGRVITQDGTVTVVETYAPWRLPLEELKQIMHTAGTFSQTNPGEAYDKDAIDKYNVCSPHNNGDFKKRYIATFSLVRDDENSPDSN